MQLSKFKQWWSGEIIFLFIGWLLFVAFIINATEAYQLQWQKGLRALSIILVFTMLFFYNYKYLIPKYLRKKSLFIYVLLLAITAAILTPPLTLIDVLIQSKSQSPNIYNELLNFFLFLFFAGILSSIFIIVADWLKSQRMMRELQKENMQSELKFLRSQVNPHFLFNTLNSLYALTLKKSDKAPEIVIKLSEIMRYMLYECNEKYVDLEKEIKYMKNYVELEQLRHGNEINIKFESNCDTEGKKIAPLMFVPFFENSFKHGVDNEIMHAYIDIKMRTEEDVVVLEIENTKGKDQVEKKLPKAGGIGLQNINRRLELLYPKAYELDIYDSDEIYFVRLKINLN